jgi:Spy/CpxP family protein refolding chaperone
MKNIISLAVLAALAASPAFADDTSTKPAAPAPAAAKATAHKHSHMGMMKKDECDEEAHGMHGHDMGHAHGMEHGYGMMGREDMSMMMEPNMHLLHALDLSAEQHAKIKKLADELKHKNWATQGLINDETAVLSDLYEADMRDPAAIGKEYQKVFDLKRQMIETYLDVQNRIEEVLTPEQRARMKEERRNMHEMYEHPMH